jgi:hypothetical protein
MSRPENGSNSLQLRDTNHARIAHSNQSPPLSVSVSGKRDFAGQRQRRQKGPSHSTDRQQRQSHARKPTNSALFARHREISVYGTAWWRTQSISNLSLCRNSLLTGKHQGILAFWSTENRFQARFARPTKALRTNSLLDGTGNFYQITREASGKVRFRLGSIILRHPLTKLNVILHTMQKDRDCDAFCSMRLIRCVTCACWGCPLGPTTWASAPATG